VTFAAAAAAADDKDAELDVMQRQRRLAQRLLSTVSIDTAARG